VIDSEVVDNVRAARLLVPELWVLETTDNEVTASVSNPRATSVHFEVSPGFDARNVVRVALAEYRIAVPIHTKIDIDTATGGEYEITDSVSAVVTVDRLADEHRLTVRFFGTDEHYDAEGLAISTSSLGWTGLGRSAGTTTPPDQLTYEILPAVATVSIGGSVWLDIDQAVILDGSRTDSAAQLVGTIESTSATFAVVTVPGNGRRTAAWTVTVGGESTAYLAEHINALAPGITSVAFPPLAGPIERLDYRPIIEEDTTQFSMSIPASLAPGVAPSSNKIELNEDATLHIDNIEYLAGTVELSWHLTGPDDLRASIAAEVTEGATGLSGSSQQLGAEPEVWWWSTPTSPIRYAQIPITHSALSREGVEVIVPRDISNQTDGSPPTRIDLIVTTATVGEVSDVVLWMS
jgi:hypothetical protein